MNWESYFASSLDCSHILEVYSFIRRKIAKSQVAILIYHRVSPKLDSWSLNPLSPLIFSEQIEYFRENYEILPLEYLSRLIRDGGSLPEKAVAITFDDGYNDNFRYAYPVLKKYNIPATIFLSTGYINTDNLFWWDKISYIINNTFVEHLSLIGIGCFFLRSDKEKFPAKNVIIERLKNLTELKKNKLIDELIKIADVEIPIGLGNKLILSWDEIRDMSLNGISFGAHTVNHPILTNMPISQAKWEIIKSKRDIENQLGKEISLFSYPNGNYSPDILELVKNAGFSCAVSVYPNRLLNPKDNIYTLGRIGANSNISEFKCVFSGLLQDLRSVMKIV